jgi:hypothetical protein
VTGAGLLYHTRHPSLIQPKWETKRSRDRIEAFFDAFFHASVPDFAAWLDAQSCRWLVLDQPWMSGARYFAGVAGNELRGVAAAAFLSPQHYRHVPGFELVYESPPRFGRRAFRAYRRT